MKTKWCQVVALAVACIGAPALGAESGDVEQQLSSRNVSRDPMQREHKTLTNN